MSDSAKNLNQMVSKLKDIDNVFKFGEKMIPVIEGFVSFISDFVPFVEQVSGSIEESRTKIPEASSQLNRVTDATELAMTEVLDKIDEITEQLANVNTYVNELEERRSSNFELIDKLKVHVKGNSEAEQILVEIGEKNDFGSILDLIKNNICKVTSSTEQITMSLQVQDITAQQLAAVNHLIISVQNKLGDLLSAVDSTSFDNKDNIKIEKLPDVHFDPNASYKETENKQDEVDSIISNGKASQEEIDKLFS